MTCRDCIYRAMCYKHEHYGYGDENNEKPCEMFRNKTDFVEVVKCKDCKHYKHFKGCGNWCHKRIHSDIEYHTKLNDFCSYGERRTDNVDV